MTGEDARQKLEKADQGLRAAIDRLARGAGADEVRELLEQVARTLQLVRSRAGVFPRAGSLSSLIRSINARAARIQLLLDSAATFYCGAIAAAAPHASVYMADGRMPPRHAGGHLSVEG